MLRWGPSLARGSAFALLVATALAGAGAGRSAAPDPAALLARYEPVVDLYRSDWKPSAIEPFLAGADLERLNGGRWLVVRRSPTPAALTDRSTSFRLDTRGCTPARDLDSCYRRRPTTATVYGRAWFDPAASTGIATVLQYWFFYPLDDWHTPPAAPILWHMHEGDWEEVSVGLDAVGHPVSVAASQHDLGVTRPWASVRVVGGTHPLVYVALGSHANYLSPGFHGVAGVPHMIPPKFSGVPLTEPDYTSSQLSLGPAGTAAGVLTVVDVTNGAPWLTFAGGWGDGSYLLIGERTKSRTVYAHVRIGGSPTGPAFHAIWRDPLLPFRSWPADDGH
jgi:hypothetical protein